MEMPSNDDDTFSSGAQPLQLRLQPQMPLALEHTQPRPVHFGPSSKHRQASRPFLNHTSSGDGHYCTHRLYQCVSRRCPPTQANLRLGQKQTVQISAATAPAQVRHQELICFVKLSEERDYRPLIMSSKDWEQIPHPPTPRLSSSPPDHSSKV
jgi:hypothetical protein